MLHKNEMVLPAWAANPLRDMIGSGASPANSNAPIAANDSGGDSHVHFHGTFWAHPRQMEIAARNARHLFGAGGKAFVLGGGSPDPYR
jgi:hypothetical protein